MEAVLLDAAGTLIEPAEPVAATYARFARKFGAEITAESLHSAFRDVFGDMPPMAFGENRSENLDDLERRWWRTLVRRVIVRTGGEFDNFDGFFEALYSHYASGRAWVLFPEVGEVLQSLVDHGYTVAVVSNFDSRLPGILVDHELRHLFAEVVYSTEVGAAKPDPRIYRYALEKLEVPPAQALHVGDDEVGDYGGATEAGLESLLLRRGDKREADRCGHVIGTLEALLPWLTARG